MKTKLTFMLLLVASITSYGQKKFDTEKQKTIELLESKRKEFQTSKNDSLYITANSDQPYRISTITRGDQAEDIEDQIFNAKIGTVVGPFDGEETFYLLKIKSMDSLNRTKAKLISFFPKGDYIKDTAKFSKLVDKYIDYIKKGKEFNKMIVNDKEVIGIRNKGVTSFWEGQTSKENYQLVFDRKSNDPYVTKGPEETNILYVIEEKRNAPYRAKATSLVKKAK